MLSWLLALRPSVILAAICVVAVSLAVVSRNWSCRKAPPPVTMVDGYEVLGAANGVALRVRSNVFRLRTLTVALQDIGAPIDGPLAELSRANLERLAGGTIRVETQRRSRQNSPAFPQPLTLRFTLSKRGAT